MNTRSPIAGLATSVSDGDNVNNFRYDRVHHRKRILAEHEVAQLVIQSRTQFGLLEQQLDCALYFIGEAETKLRYFRFLPRSGFI